MIGHEVYSNLACKEKLLNVYYTYFIPRLRMNNIYQKLVIILVGAISAIVLYQATNDLTVMAQKDNDNDISISLENSSYVQSNSTASKLNVLVNYDVENKTLRDEKINGVMKIYASNGTLVKYSSFPRWVSGK